MSSIPIQRGAIGFAVFLATALLTMPIQVVAQNGDPDQTRESSQIQDRVTDSQQLGDLSRDQLRDQPRDRSRDGTLDPLRDQIRERIDQDPSLGAQDRQRMRQHLQDCLDLGASAQELEAIFPAPGEGRSLDTPTMLRMQARVRDLLREGIAADPVLEKVREGQVKGVADRVIERVAAQMEGHVRTAHQFLDSSREAGIQPPADRRQRRMLERHLALDLWSGMGEGDLDQLRQRAQLRDGSCGASELVAAADASSQIRQHGVSPGRSMELIGDALQAGYTAHEMRMLGAMMSAADLRQHSDDVLDHLHEGMNHHRELEDMAREMMSWGWMGPADMGHEGGWGNMMDDWMGGGPGDHHDDDGGHMGGGGMGGGDTGGGGMGGGMGG